MASSNPQNQTPKTESPSTKRIKTNPSSTPMADETEDEVALVLDNGRVSVNKATVEALKEHCASEHFRQCTNGKEIKISGVLKSEMLLFLQCFKNAKFIPANFAQLCPLISLSDKFSCKLLNKNIVCTFRAAGEILHLLEAGDRARSVDIVQSCIRMGAEFKANQFSALETRVSPGTLYAMAKYLVEVKETENKDFVDEEDNAEEDEHEDVDYERDWCSNSCPKCGGRMGYYCDGCNDKVRMKKYQRENRMAREAAKIKISTHMFFK